MITFHRFFFFFFFSPIRSLDCLYQYHWCQIMAVGILLKQRIFVKISLMIRAYFNHLCAIYAQKQPSYDSKESCDIKGLPSGPARLTSIMQIIKSRILKATLQCGDSITISSLELLLSDLNYIFFLYWTFTCTCKHKIHNHQSYVYYDVPGNKK